MLGWGEHSTHCVPATASLSLCAAVLLLHITRLQLISTLLPLSSQNQPRAAQILVILDGIILIWKFYLALLKPGPDKLNEICIERVKKYFPSHVLIIHPSLKFDPILGSEADNSKLGLICFACEHNFLVLVLRTLGCRLDQWERVLGVTCRGRTNHRPEPRNTLHSV